MNDVMADRGINDASAFWIFGPGQGALRSEPIREPDEDEVLIQALASAVSRGTETLIFQGRVPESQHKKMRAPFQEGEFTFPIKYGYASVGRVLKGPENLLGQRVFCLYPHQNRYVVPVSAVVPVPDAVPTERAVLAANMETALNGLWDVPPKIGDRIAVIGCGVVGMLAACLAADVPGTWVGMIDTNPDKAALAQALDLPFASPAEVSGEADLVIHASGNPEGLKTALDIASFEATILDLSWYGDQSVSLQLGENFHSRRLKLISSQVGSVAPAMRGRWSHRDRLTLALSLLADDMFDVLLTPIKHFSQLPTIMSNLTNGDDSVMCQVITYD